MSSRREFLRFVKDASTSRPSEAQTGIDQHIREQGGRAGHHGLSGMHERAKLAGGKLTVWSERDLGTEIELTIPAVLVYAGTPGARESSA